ncbi:MAG: hypothetical protein A4E53_03390 [Pelotomaculum sp. PtaB.Bin104]|nr:MAG: hypothetical protein A4E53_03390 [Pelotomaculum sp. PtaB.Bin104]
MRKKLSLVLVLIFLFTSVLPAFAGEVKTFGFDDYRHRENTVNGTMLYPFWYHDGGRSYSQPLILPGSKWGLIGKVVITVEGNVLYGYLVPDTPPESFSPITPAWSVQLDGNEPTTSHPTLLEKNGKKYVYIGTYSPYLDIVDITNFNNVNQGSLISRPSPLATDITSAPLILNWEGHEIIVNTTGNSGKIFIVTDPLDNFKNNDFYIDIGSGRTSSSPAPVAGGTAFAVGLDCGFQTHGELRLYYLDDILSEDSSGKTVCGLNPTTKAFAER